MDNAYFARFLLIALIFAFGIAIAEEAPEPAYQAHVDRVLRLLPPHSGAPGILDLSQSAAQQAGASQAWEKRFTGSMGVREHTDPRVEEPAGNGSVATTTTEYATPSPALPARSCDTILVVRPVSCHVHMAYNRRFVYSEYSLEVLTVFKSKGKPHLRQNTQITGALLGGTIRFPSGHVETLLLAHNGFMELGKPYVLFAWKPIPSDPLYMIPEGYLIQDDVVFPLNIDAGQLDYAGMPYKKFEARVKAAIAKNIDTD